MNDQIELFGPAVGDEGEAPAIAAARPPARRGSAPTIGAPTISSAELATGRAAIDSAISDAQTMLVDAADESTLTLSEVAAVTVTREDPADTDAERDRLAEVHARLAEMFDAPEDAFDEPAIAFDTLSLTPPAATETTAAPRTEAKAEAKTDPKTARPARAGAPLTTDADPAIDPATLLVIDGTAMLFRAYYGLGSRKAPSGAEVGAVTGVCHQLLGVLRRQPADKVVVVFDAAQETFRNRIDPRYKQNRGDPPDELVPQFDLIKEVSEALGFCTLAKLDFEADDLMATLAALARRAGVPSRLVAIDKDLCQSVIDDAPACDLCDPKSDELTDGAGVVRRLGVRPHQVIDLMALTGDSTDNVQGVRGVGPKAAVALLEAFGDLDGIYRNLERVEFLGVRGAKGIARKLEEGRDEAFLARRLVALDAAVDLAIAETELGDRTRWGGPGDHVDDLFTALGLRGPLMGFRRLHGLRPSCA